MPYALSTPRGYTIPASVSVAPTYSHYAHCVLSISAEVVRSTADPKSIKGLQISKPVFQVRNSVIMLMVIFKIFCYLEYVINLEFLQISLVLIHVCVCYVIVRPTESTNWYLYGYHALKRRLSKN